MKIKICGVTHPEDAKLAAQLGAHYIGIILAKGFRRSVPLLQALEIANAARRYGSEPVAVFVEECFEEILDLTAQTNISKIELHGNKSMQNLSLLQFHFKEIFYAVSSNQEIILPVNVVPLYDHSKGTGKPFDWKSFSPPSTSWFLGGGLNADNIVEALELLKPHGITVSSAIELAGTTRKDPQLLEKFIKNILGAVPAICDCALPESQIAGTALIKGDRQ